MSATEEPPEVEPASEVTLTIRPSPRASIWPASARASRNGPSTLVTNTS